MPVVSAENFPTLFNTTRPSRLTSAEDIVNHVQKVSYPFLELVRGADPFDLAQGGTSIVEVGHFNDTNRFTKYNPGDQASVQNVDTTATLTFPWRFYRSDVSWTDFAYNANTRNGDFVQVKKFQSTIELKRESEHLRGMDALMFAQPNYDLMENPSTPAAGGECYSIPAFISENSSTFLPPSTVWGTSSIAQRDPSVYTGWRNKIATYTGGAPLDTTAGILAAFDTLEPQLIYSAVPEASTATKATNQGDIVIYTNLNGEALLRQAARAGNDRWSNPGDGSFPRPKFDGIPVIYCPQLDTALLEEVSGAYTNNPYPTNKPRYFWVNKRHLAPRFLEGEMLKAKPAARDPVNYPDTTVVWTVTTLGLMCNARNRQGIVCPS